MESDEHPRGIHDGNVLGDIECGCICNGVGDEFGSLVGIDGASLPGIGSEAVGTVGLGPGEGEDGEGCGEEVHFDDTDEMLRS